VGWKRVKLIVRHLLFICLVIVLGLIIPRLIMMIYSAPHTHQIDDAPQSPVGIIFGAGLWRDGSPTPVLEDRVLAGAQLYFNGKIKKLLMSGDNSYIDYNEPEAMRQYALKLGVPDQDIILDYAGRRTYDTCYRARYIFGVTEALLITQNFHLPRALYLCSQIGISSQGVIADTRQYRFPWRFIWQIRELPASLAAMWEVHISHPTPIMGDPEPIFPEGINGSPAP
jgi:SanA protein